jgi:hypothetical protein
MAPTPERTVSQTHYRYFELIDRYGTASERQAAIETMRLMKEVREAAGEGARWGPMEEVVLPEFLVSKATREAGARHRRATGFHLHDKFGVRRSLDEEIRTTKAQFAAVLMIGSHFEDLPANHAAGKKSGNLGKGRSVLCPKEGNFGVLVTQDEKPSRLIFVVDDEGEDRFAMAGYVRAGEMMLDKWEKSFVRKDAEGNDVPSHPWIGPREMLLPLDAWFDE